MDADLNVLVPGEVEVSDASLPFDLIGSVLLAQPSPGLIHTLLTDSRQLP